jgi:hypothetical protein
MPASDEIIPPAQDLTSKPHLRRLALSCRAGVSEAERQTFAEQLAIRGVELARRAMTRTVALYWPIGEEADPRLLLQALGYHEFTTVLPVTVGRGQPLVFRKWKWGQPLVEGASATAPAITMRPCRSCARRALCRPSGSPLPARRSTACRMSRTTSRWTSSSPSAKQLIVL